MYYQGCAYSVLRTVHYTVWGSSPLCFCYTFQTRGCIIKAVHIKRSELSIILFGVRVLSVSVTLFKPADVLSRLCILSAPNCPLYCLGFESFLYLLHFSNPWMYYQGCAYSVVRTVHYTVWGSSPLCFCYTFQTRGCIIKAVHIKRSELSIILFGVRVLSVSVTLFKPADVLSRLCILSAPNCPLYCLGFESFLYLLHFSNPRMYYQGCAYSVLRTVHYTVWGSSPFCICYTFQTRGCIIKAVHIKRSELSIILFGVRVLSVSVTLFKPADVLSRLFILSAPNCTLYCLGVESSLFLLHFSNPWMYYQGCAY